jgi:hypothetical protein
LMLLFFKVLFPYFVNKKKWGQKKWGQSLIID